MWLASYHGKASVCWNSRDEQWNANPHKCKNYVADILVLHDVVHRKWRKWWQAQKQRSMVLTIHPDFLYSHPCSWKRCTFALFNPITLVQKYSYLSILVFWNIEGGWSLTQSLFQNSKMVGHRWQQCNSWVARAQNNNSKIANSLLNDF